VRKIEIYCEESEQISSEKSRRTVITIPGKQLGMVLHDLSVTINNIRNWKLCR